MHKISLLYMEDVFGPEWNLVGQSHSDENGTKTRTLLRSVHSADVLRLRRGRVVPPGISL